jgi:hypothetical protein
MEKITIDLRCRFKTTLKIINAFKQVTKLTLLWAELLREREDLS